MLSTIFGCANSFVVAPSKIPSSTALEYTVIGGIEPEEQDTEARELVKEMMTHRTTEHGKDQYAGYDATLSEAEMINRDINVDAYANPIGGIMPGYQLSALCGDD